MLFIKAIENVFRVCIAWYKHERGWENSRQLRTVSSRVCITVSNSPNPSWFISGYANTENIFYCLNSDSNNRIILYCDFLILFCVGFQSNKSNFDYSKPSSLPFVRVKLRQWNVQQWEQLCETFSFETGREGQVLSILGTCLLRSLRVNRARVSKYINLFQPLSVTVCRKRPSPLCDHFSL